MFRWPYLFFYASYEVESKCVAKLSVSAFQRTFSHAFWTMFDSSTTLWRENLVKKLVKIRQNLSQNPRTILERVKTFRFPSIKSFKNVVWPFWSYRKIALTVENIPDTYKLCQKCVEEFLWTIFKNDFFFENPFFWSEKHPKYVCNKAFWKKSL